MFEETARDTLPHDRVDHTGVGASGSGLDDDGGDRDGIVITLSVDDAEIADRLRSKRPGREREHYALTALKIGVLALEQAGSRIDSDRLRHEGDRLMENLALALNSHREELSGSVSKALGDYFDPGSGRLTQRIERLVQKDGEIETVIRSQIEGDGSLLTRKLQDHLGQNSPVMALLDPQAETGLAANLAGSVERAAVEQRERILREFSLDNPESALARTLRELTTAHGAAGEALEKRIEAVVAEFSLDKEDGALSRLVRRVDQSQKLLSAEFSLDQEGSALARMRKDLLDQIALLTREQQAFQTEIVSRLKEMAARKDESLKSTTHGHDFETMLLDAVSRLCEGRGDLVIASGTTTGLIKNCKKGDIVIEMGPDHAVPGARIVIEAKQNASVSTASAREEIGEARKNRDADVGLFVFSARSAPTGLNGVSRFGDDVFVVWDADDTASDLFLMTGLSLASALITKRQAGTGALTDEFREMEKAVLSIQKQAAYLDEFEKQAATITGAAEKIHDRVRKMRTALKREVSILEDAVSDIKQSIK